MSKVLVLGASGMLGSAVFRNLEKNGLNTLGTYSGKTDCSANNFMKFDAECDDLEKFIRDCSDLDFIINCIGAIPQKNVDDSLIDLKKMIQLNAVLPNILKFCAEKYNINVIQIATDCVFDGKSGPYNENSEHLASDIYGVSKSLGEVTSKKFMILRCSIIGKDDPSNASLYNWLTNQPKNTTINGYVNHFWNGITTQAFSQIVLGIILSDFFIPGKFNLIPKNSISKFELLSLIRKVENREDLTIREFESINQTDRRLSTLNPNFVEKLWLNGGFGSIPTIQDLVESIDKKGDSVK
jgi:dTDP-4-dehydrorhamnose reductase